VRSRRSNKNDDDEEEEEEEDGEEDGQDDDGEDNDSESENGGAEKLDTTVYPESRSCCTRLLCDRIPCLLIFLLTLGTLCIFTIQIVNFTQGPNSQIFVSSSEAPLSQAYKNPKTESVVFS